MEQEGGMPPQSQGEHWKLTPAEAEALRMVAEGAPDEAIAAELKISLSAVRSRLQRFYDRTGLHGRRVVCWAKDHLGCCIQTA